MNVLGVGTGQARDGRATRAMTDHRGSDGGTGSADESSESPGGRPESPPADHLLVLGVGDLTEPIIAELRETANVPIVVVARPDERVGRLRAAGVSVIEGDPMDEDPLRRAGIEAARAAIVATSNDGADALAVLTARELNPTVRIVAAVTNRENAEKLELAGATTVISPTTIGGRMLVQSALGQSGMEDLADRLLAEDGEPPRRDNR